MSSESPISVIERKRAKTENLSLRLDPKTKFILEFVARLRGQSITTVVERAIKDSASGVTLGTAYDNRGNEIGERNWQHYWDTNEGIRTLKLLADSSYPSTFEEDELRDFTRTHWKFFYLSESTSTPKRAYVEILWPRIIEYLEIWRTTKTEDYWAAGKAMSAALAAAKVAGPDDWPPKPKATTRKVSDLDDDIPF